MFALERMEGLVHLALAAGTVFLTKLNEPEIDSSPISSLALPLLQTSAATLLYLKCRNDLQQGRVTGICRGYYRYIIPLNFAAVFSAVNAGSYLYSFALTGKYGIHSLLNGLNGALLWRTNLKICDKMAADIKAMIEKDKLA